MPVSVLLGVPDGLYSKNLLSVIEALGSCVDEQLTENVDMVIVGTADAAVYQSAELAQAVNWKNQGAALAVLKDEIFVKSLRSCGWIK